MEWKEFENTRGSARRRHTVAGGLYSIEDPLRGSTAGPPFLILDVAEFHFGRSSESSKLHGKTFENQCLEASECP